MPPVCNLCKKDVAEDRQVVFQFGHWPGAPTLGVCVPCGDAVIDGPTQPVDTPVGNFQRRMSGVVRRPA